MSAIAVDAGTSVIKAITYADDGTQLACVKQRTRIDRPRPGWAEQDMLEVWSLVVAAIRELLRHAPDPIRFLALTAQGDGCWLVDDSGLPTGPAILWSDARAAEIVNAWAAQGVLEPAFRVSGCVTFAGLPNAILTWLANHDPARLAKSAAVLTCGGWLHLQLTGRLAVDESDAAAPFLDKNAREYSARVHELFGTANFAHMLPAVRADHDRVSPLQATAAQALGLPEGLPVVLAPYDLAATSIGAGATEPGQACAILGTTLCTQVVQGAPVPANPPAGLTIPIGPGTTVLRAFPSLVGTDVLHWARRLLKLPRVEDLNSLARQAPQPHGEPLTFLPYLSPAGERAPFLDPSMRGALLGLTVAHQPPDIARAIIEGLSHVIADALKASGAEIQELRCCGGGARSDVWCQMIADDTGLVVARPADDEVGARGAFLVGLVSTGLEANLSEAAVRHSRLSDRFRPRTDLAPYFRTQLERFARTRDALRSSWSGPGGGFGDHDG